MKHFFIIPHFIEVVDIEHINIFQWYMNVQFCSTWASKWYDIILLRTKKLFGVDNYTEYVRDAFHRYVVNSEYSDGVTF